ncbi:MAG TPA: aminotransferase class V-fold PLP-dependent enzyme [Chloroflexota bacterium]|nr:aminotransferase class V-fold PLP-dependent enzyme [Chloroflexota bacterium]
MQNFEQKQEKIIAHEPSQLDIPAIRRDLPATSAIAYLNTGTSGPLPAPAVAALAEAAASEGSRGRLDPAAIARFRRETPALRRALAQFLGADEAEIGLTHHTTEGVNVALWGLDWQPGDRIVTTTLEHAGVLVPLFQAQRRYGVDIVFADVGNGERGLAEAALLRAIQPGVRMVVLSHVAWSTGAVLPLAEVIDRAHRVGALVCVDGAQSVGALAVGLDALQADVYAFPGQKWLCGPEGTGGVFVRAATLERIQPVVSGFHSAHYQPNKPPSLEFESGAARYEVASIYRPGVYGLQASVAWLQRQGPIFPAISALASWCLSQLSNLPGVEILTPSNAELSGLVSFRLEGVDAEACTAFLAERKVAIRSIPDNQALRISCGFFNTREEIDHTLALIGEFRAG